MHEPPRDRVDRRSGIRRIVAMEIVSGAGDGAFWVGLTALLINRGVGAAGLAVAALVRLGPRAIISAPSVVLADRFDRRRLLVGIDLVRAVLMTVVALGAAHRAGVGVLLALVLAGYTVAAPYRPAITAALPLVAGESGLAAATALVSTVRQVMTFVGPVVGAAAVVLWSPAVAITIDAGTFVVSAALLVRVPGMTGRRAGTDSLASHRAEWRSELGSGWRDVRSTPGAGLVTMLVLAMYAARGAELVLYVLLAERLSMGDGGVGVLLGAVGLGAIAMLPIGARIGTARSAVVLVGASAVASALPFVVLWSMHTTAAACALLAVVGVGVAAFEICSVVVLQRLVRREALSRVFGVVGSASNAGKLVGALAIPAVVSRWGLHAGLVGTGAVVAGVGLAALPLLRSTARSVERRRDELAPVVARLGDLAILRHAPPSALERIAAEIRVEQVGAGTELIREDDPADDLFVLVAGTCDVSDHGRTINTMSAGEWFGEIGLLQRRPRTATVTATTDAVVWRIPGDAFLAALEDTAVAPADLYQVMADRLARSAR